MEQIHYVVLPKSVARERGISYYFTGVPCKRGHLSKRFVSGACCQCDVEAKRADKVGRAAYRAENKDKRAAWQVANKDKVAAQQAAWYAANRDKVAAQRAAYRATNKDKIAAYNAEHGAAIDARRRPYRTEFCNRRRAQKLNATPVWLTDADRAAMQELYAESVFLTNSTGQPYHVDHILPLKGKIVCGLHIPKNLRVMPGNENISKGNRLTPEDLRMVEAATLADARRATESEAA